MGYGWVILDGLSGGVPPPAPLRAPLTRNCDKWWTREVSQCNQFELPAVITKVRNLAKSPFHLRHWLRTF